MSSSTGSPPDGSAHEDRLDDHTEREAGALLAMEEIFQSAPFRASRQCQSLLRYIVAHTLAGEDHLLRERVIGMEVFGRKPDYDTGDDPVVRLRAADVRKRLAQFYQQPGTHPRAPRIHIPSGSYRATFDWHTDPVPLAAEVLPVDHSEEHAALREAPDTVVGVAVQVDRPVRSPVAGKHLGWALAATMLLCALVAAAFLIRDHKNAAVDAFWGPLLKDAHPALICVGSNAVYRLSNDFLLRYEKDRGENHANREFLIEPKPGELMDQRDLLRANDSFVALGDVSATSAIVQFLTKKNKAFNERFPQDMSFAEVQENSSAMIGGFNNRMALTINKDLRFTLQGSNQIRDRVDPKRLWDLQFNGDARDSEDFALITRLVESNGHETVTLGGIGQYGTQAAADFLTSAPSLARWAKTAPADWQAKNLQLVLHVKIIDYRPISTEVVMTHVW